MAIDTPPDKFSDAFTSVIDPAWTLVNRGGGTVSWVAGTMQLQTAAGNDNSLTSHLFPYAALPVGAARGFFAQFKISSLAISSGTNRAAFGIGLFSPDADVAGDLRQTLTPVVEFGGTTAGAPSTFFSYTGENEIGRKFSTTWPAASFLVRVMRTENVVFAEFSTDSGVTWQAFNTTFLQRTILRRYENTEHTTIDGEWLAFYIRGAHPQDTAGITVAIDDFDLTTWDHLANAPTLGNLRSHSWVAGQRIDLEWTNPPAGKDTLRSLTIVRSQMAPPEVYPVDNVIEPEPGFVVDLTTPQPVFLPSSSDEFKSKYPAVPMPTTWWKPIVQSGFTQVPPAFGDGTFFVTNGAATAASPGVGINTGRMRIDKMPELIDVAAVNPPKLQASLSSLGDIRFGNPFGLWFVFRVCRPPTATRTLASNVNSGLTNGWRLQMDTAGQLLLTQYGTGSRTATLAHNYADGAWHAFLVRFNWTSGNIETWGDLTGFASGPALGLLTGTQGVLTFGASEAAGDSSIGFQIAAIGAWDGAAALNVGETQARLLFEHGKVPVTLAPTVTPTYTRASIAAGEWGGAEDDLGGGVHVAKYAPSSAYATAQFWHSYHDNYEHATRMDGGFDVAVTNMVVDSEGTSGVTFTSATSDTAYESPNGLRNGIAFTQTALDGRAVWLTTGLTSGQDYWVTVYLKAKTGNGHKATVWIRDAADATVNVDQKNTIYLQPYWQRFSFKVSTGAGTGFTVRIYGGFEGVDTNKSAAFFGRMIHLASSADYVTDYIPTPPATTAARALAVLYFTATALGAFVTAARGEIRSQFRRVKNSIAASDGYIFIGLRSDASINDRFFQRVLTTDAIRSSITSGVGVDMPFSSGVVAPGTPIEGRLTWNSAAPVVASDRIASYQDGVLGGSAQGANYTVGAGVDRLIIGAFDTGGTIPLRGGVAFVNFYSGSNPIIDIPKIPEGIGLDPLGKVIYQSTPIGAPGAAASYTDTDVTPGKFYYYALYPTRIPLAVASFVRPANHWTRKVLGPLDLDLGPMARRENMVSSLAMRDIAAMTGPRRGTGKYVYNEFPLIYRQIDEAERKAEGRLTGLLDDYSMLMQRGIDTMREYTTGMHSVLDPEIGPMGLMGLPQNLTAICDAMLTERGINPAALGLLAITRRRLWIGILPLLKRKATRSMLVDLVELVSGWKIVDSFAPGLDSELRFLRTWNGVTTLTRIDQPVTGMTLGAGFITVPGAGWSVNKWAGGLWVDWFGNVKKITSNTVDTITFDDATFTPYAERTFTAPTVQTGDTAVLSAADAPNDNQYDQGFIHQQGLGAAVAIDITGNSPPVIRTAGGLTNGSNQAIAVAKSYTGNFAGRIPNMVFELFDGEHSHLYNPMSNLTLKGTPDDPFFVMHPGFSPTGSGFQYPVSIDDIIILAPDGAAYCANDPLWWISDDGLECIIDGQCPNARPGDYLNPNRNQSQWFIIVDVHSLGERTHLSVQPVASIGGSTMLLNDVAKIGDLATIAPRLTVEHDRAIRAVLGPLMPINGRVFVYYM